jgi:putative ABC transport system ATP-binding protein
VRVAELESVSRSYRVGGQEVRALDDVSLRLDAGEHVAVMGPSGSGKSTLLHVLGLLDRPDAGRVRLEGEDVAALSDEALSRRRALRVGFVFQGFHLVPTLDVLENVALPLLYADRSPEEARARARALVDRVGLLDRARHRPSELSGGQQQRVAIARALANDPALVLADEPTGNLDRRTGADVLALLDEVPREGRTLVVVTHDPGVAARADRVLHMLDGRIASASAGALRCA